MPLLTINQLTKAYGGDPIFDCAELHMHRGEKLGLVGRNGTGKSTLLRILAGIETADSGTIAFRQDIHVAFLAQEPDLGAAKTLLDVALAGAAKCRLPMETYERQMLAEQALKGLGIVDFHLSVDVASGGTRRRAALAAALLQQPDLLLLDEPTNHLDADTANWLEKQLITLPSALIVVTHDRYFLNQVVGRIVELRRGKLHNYEGTFQDYLESRLDEESLADQVEANRRNRMKIELAWLRRSPAARSTKPKARIERAQAVLVSEREVQKSVQLPGLSAERLGKTILETRALQVGYLPSADRPGKIAIRYLDLTLVRGQRLGIVGPNGAGKTTLLRTLCGELPALGGTLKLGQNTQILAIDQHRSGLDPLSTVQNAATPQGGDWVQIGENRVHVAGYLEKFLFKSGDLRQQVSTLSGGQRFRLLLARRLQEPMNLLILDEPTNDLDFETLEVLEESLLQYQGCLLTVSHDRAFLDRVCTGILHVVGDGELEVHPGNYSQFLANQTTQRKAEAQIKLAQRPVQAQVKHPAAPLKLSFHEEKRLASIEAEIELAESSVAAAESQLADPTVLSDYSRLQLATRAHQEATLLRDQLYELWQSLEAKQGAWLQWKSLKQ